MVEGAAGNGPVDRLFAKLMTKFGGDGGVRIIGAGAADSMSTNGGGGAARMTCGSKGNVGGMTNGGGRSPGNNGRGRAAGGRSPGSTSPGGKIGNGAGGGFPLTTTTCGDCCC